ncbi:MAG: hypothetical protein V3T72_08345, partial [Thermoanaerobaculia bacterium]
MERHPAVEDGGGGVALIDLERPQHSRPAFRPLAQQPGLGRNTVAAGAAKLRPIRRFTRRDRDQSEKADDGETCHEETSSAHAINPASEATATEPPVGVGCA